MTPLQLARKIKSLPAHPPHTVALEKLLLRGRPTWYASQKQHWLGWLEDYASPKPMVESCSIRAELHCDGWR